ncbi:hypothetical protein NEOLI_001892 [Neolecta irregularis DAH-3]|uniref:Uncharacterized protein n=1 Tax=Neolecta irregularis (strain DAH-3) TaxID=1198029 RepID=A0A1U7LWB5_NEOID|nr:hypothetical protein NEOLI_001892 [Neolecta irregularis DAH-3]|eukprot:OLL26863.1 hypothetical protein NEOLI_001892 [Neolecta irregularis DAH-3]
MQSQPLPGIALLLPGLNPLLRPQISCPNLLGTARSLTHPHLPSPSKCSPSPTSDYFSEDETRMHFRSPKERPILRNIQSNISVHVQRSMVSFNEVIQPPSSRKSSMISILNAFGRAETDSNVNDRLAPIEDSPVLSSLPNKDPSKRPRKKNYWIRWFKYVPKERR